MAPQRSVFGREKALLLRLIAILEQSAYLSNSTGCIGPHYPHNCVLTRHVKLCRTIQLHECHLRTCCGLFNLSRECQHRLVRVRTWHLLNLPRRWLRKNTPREDLAEPGECDPDERNF